MLGIPKLWTAMARLAGEVEALATTTAEINRGIRARLHLDGEGHVEALGHIVEDDQAEEQPGARGGRGRRKSTTG